MSRSTLTFEPGGALRSRLVSRMLAESLPTLDPGTLVGPFRVLKTLGHGGLGVVYLAERADGAFEQSVALKLIAPEADPGVAEVLLARERRLLARLQHPNIARLLDGGRSDEGMLWFAMEHLQGERIDHWCKARQMKVAGRIGLLLSVCSAVAYAHARLVVHRDIKPSNILVDAQGVPHLLDFGIAAALDDSSDDPARRAATPGYASPEQSRGDPAGVSQDVYQLGRLLEKLLKEAPDHRDNQDMDAILQRALAETPEHRYASVEALASDLRAWLKHCPVSARPATVTYRFSRFLRRHRLASAVTALVLLAITAMTGGFLWHLDIQRERAEREARTARHVSDFMIELFSAADPALHHGQVPRVDVLLAKAPERIATQLAGEPAIQAELLARIGQTYLTLRDFNQAEPVLQESVRLTRNLPEVDATQRAERLRMLALALTGKDAVRGRSLFLEALALLRPDSREHARTYNIVQQNLAMLDLSQDNDAAAIERLEHALAHGRLMLDEGQPAVVADLLGLGNAMRKVQRMEDSLAYFQQAHDSARNHLGASHPYTVLASGGLALALAHAGRHDDALAPINQTLDAALQIYGDPSPNYTLALLQAGNVATLAGRAEDALWFLEKALAASEKLPPGNNNLLINVLDSLAEQRLKTGDATGAEAAYRRMLAWYEAGGDLSPPALTLKLAEALAAQGHCEEALAQYQRGRALAGATGGMGEEDGSAWQCRP